MGGIVVVAGVVEVGDLVAAGGATWGFAAGGVTVGVQAGNVVPGTNTDEPEGVPHIVPPGTNSRLRLPAGSPGGQRTLAARCVQQSSACATPAKNAVTTKAAMYICAAPEKCSRISQLDRTLLSSATALADPPFADRRIASGVARLRQ